MMISRSVVCFLFFLVGENVLLQTLSCFIQTLFYGRSIVPKVTVACFVAGKYNSLLSIVSKMLILK